ncbi:MAG: TatD family hydrolase [Verrucomicrobiota bacterium]
MLIETHCHLDFPDFQDDLSDVIKRAEDAGVSRMISIGTDLPSSRRAIQLAEKFPSVYATVGIHPCDVKHAHKADLIEIEKLTAHPKVVAIGECGLDYHKLQERNPQNNLKELKEKQLAFFQAQIEICVRQNINMVIHQRDSWQPLMHAIQPYQNKFKGVFHCFGGTLPEAQEVITQGHLISFTGIVTFKNAKGVQQTAAEVAEDCFMIETDCPFLAPVPHRGKRCEPAHVQLVAQKMAELRKCDVEQVIHATGQNALNFFRWPD